MTARRRIFIAWAGLLVLLGLTIAATFAPLGPLLPFVSYGIAVAKAGIVVWVFMEMRKRDGLERLAFATGIIWLLLLLALSLLEKLFRLSLPR